MEDAEEIKMKTTQFKQFFYLLALLVSTSSVLADTNRTFAVIMPESVDGRWYWYSTPMKQHIVQAQIEKALIRAGHKVLHVSDNASLQGLFDGRTFLKQETINERAKAAGVTHIISGAATATGTDRSTAYGIPVYRSRANLSARITETATSSIVAVETTDATEGGQGYLEAGKLALKSGAKSMGDALLKAIRKLDRDQ